MSSGAMVTSAGAPIEVNADWFTAALTSRASGPSTMDLVLALE